MEPLDMSRFPGRRELNVERGALSRRRAHINLSRMFLDDAVGNGEAKAGAAAIGFGGEERIKDAVDVFARDSRAGIRNFDFYTAIVRSRADFQHSATGHSISRVQKEVQKNLLQFVRGTVDGRNRLGKLFHHLNPRGLQGMSYERESFFN